MFGFGRFDCPHIIWIFIDTVCQKNGTRISYCQVKYVFAFEIPSPNISSKDFCLCVRVCSTAYTH